MQGSLRQPRSHLTFDDSLQQRDCVVIEVDAQHPGLGGKLKREAFGLRCVPGSVLGADPRSEQKLIAGRGKQRPRRSPSSLLQIPNSQRPVG
jgi:hypothetical protein